MKCFINEKYRGDIEEYRGKKVMKYLNRQSFRVLLLLQPD